MNIVDPTRLLGVRSPEKWRVSRYTGSRWVRGRWRYRRAIIAGFSVRHLRGRGARNRRWTALPRVLSSSRQTLCRLIVSMPFQRAADLLCYNQDRGGLHRATAIAQSGKEISDIILIAVAAAHAARFFEKERKKKKGILFFFFSSCAQGNFIFAIPPRRFVPPCRLFNLVRGRPSFYIYLCNTDKTITGNGRGYGEATATTATAQRGVPDGS